MSDATKTADRIIGRLYTNFILRDLTFFVSGSIVLAAAVDKPLEFIRCKLSINIEQNWVALIAFLAIAYVLGVLLQEAARIPLEKASKSKIKNSCEIPEECEEHGYYRNEPLVVKSERLLRNKIREHSMNGLERILFLKQIAATQFVTIGAIAIVLIARSVGNDNGSPGPALVLLILGMALCWDMYLKKALEQEQIIYGLLQVKMPEECGLSSDKEESGEETAS